MAVRRVAAVVAHVRGRGLRERRRVFCGRVIIHCTEEIGRLARNFPLKSRPIHRAGRLIPYLNRKPVQK